MNLSDFSIRASNAISQPAVQIALPVGCGLWLWAGLPESFLTLLLSILALTLSQLVLAAGRRFEASVQAKLDELIASGDARDELLRVEQQSEAEIERLRR